MVDFLPAVICMPVQTAGTACQALLPALFPCGLVRTNRLTHHSVHEGGQHAGKARAYRAVCSAATSTVSTAPA